MTDVAAMERSTTLRIAKLCRQVGHAIRQRHEFTGDISPDESLMSIRSWPIDLL